MSSAIARAAPAVLVTGLAAVLVARFDTALIASDTAETLGAADASTSPGCSGATVEGPVVWTEWGPIQVVAEVDNGLVCAADAVRYPDGDEYSLSISRFWIPRINARVAAAGDASFDTISGATVTSDGYRDSLQAILDAS